MKSYHRLFWLVIACCAFTCDTSKEYAAKANVEPSLPTRNKLWNAFREIGKITFVYGNEESRFLQLFEQAGDSLNMGNGRYLKLEAKSAKEVTSEEIKQKVLFLLGTPQTNELIAQLKHRLPIEWSSKGIKFDGRLYTTPSSVFKLFFYPNPVNPHLPLYLITGNTEKAVYEMILDTPNFEWTNLFWSSWGYELFEKKQRQVFGRFADTTWQMDKRIHFDFSVASDTILKTPNFTFIQTEGIINGKEIEELANSCELAYTNIQHFLGLEKMSTKISYHLYSSMEEKGLRLQNTNQAHCDFNRHCVHVIKNANFQGDLLQQENEIILRDQLGKPKLAALEKGLAISFTKNWQRKGYQYWVSKLKTSGNLPPLKEVLDNEVFNKDSRYVMPPVAAAFTNFLLEYWGKTAFLEKYANWTPSNAELEILEPSWTRYLKENYSSVNSTKKSISIPYLKGFNYAHEGYRIYNGYGSKQSRQSLEKLANLGTNSIAIVPYSYMRNPNVPSYIPIIDDAGSENDESVIFAFQEAKKMGMLSMLKPQIWLGRSWPGDIEMKNESAWDQFFDHYYRWIRHYAMLAEIQEMEMLCLGVEFAKATVQQPERWRVLIKKIRGLYSGKLTYAANWGDEFEKMTFWDELDYIGLNCYYPLNDKEDVSKAALKKQFADVMKKVDKVCKKYDKKLIFTEIGFRSVDAPWKNPHANANGRSFNAEHQQLCYEVVFEGIQDKEWSKGILWWKWPCYLDYRGAKNTSFTPNRKMAEKTVEDWFNRLPN